MASSEASDRFKFPSWRLFSTNRFQTPLQTATDAWEFIFSSFLTHFLSDEEWEKDLAAEIQDFEVVDDGNADDSDLEDLKWNKNYLRSMR